MVWHDQFNPRHFQSELVKTTRARAVARKPVTVALVSPGSGKTLGYQAVATDLMRHVHDIDFVAVYVPRVVLAKQAELDWRHTDETSGQDNGDFALFDPKCRLERLRHRGNVSPLLPPGVHREGYVTTYQSLTTEPDLHIDWAREHADRFLLIGDEAQFLGAPLDEEDENNPKAGQHFEQLAQYARHVLLLTGTEERADGRKLILCSDFYIELSDARLLLDQLRIAASSDGASPRSFALLLTRIDETRAWAEEFTSFRAFLTGREEDGGLGMNEVAFLHIAELGGVDDLARKLLYREVEPTRNTGRPTKEDNSRGTRISGEADTADSVVARLKRDDPDLADQVVSGEVSPNKAATQKGWRKPRIVVSSPERVATSLRKHMNPDDLGTLAQLLMESE